MASSPVGELLQKFLQKGFRLIEGEDLNQVIAAVNNNCTNWRVIQYNSDLPITNLDHTVIIRKIVGSTTNVVLPTGNNVYPGRRIQVKDGAGDAAVNTITIVGPIDGSQSYVFSYAYESIDLQFDGTWWNIL